MGKDQFLCGKRFLLVLTRFFILAEGGSAKQQVYEILRLFLLFINF